MSKKDLIIQAMDSRKSIVANYDGRMRILSPYELGWKNGNLRCLFYQSGGGSNSGFIRSGSKNNWRCLDLYKLTNIRISDESIQAPIIKPRRGYNNCIDTRIKKIHF